MLNRDELRSIPVAEKIAWCVFAALMAVALYLLFKYGDAGDKIIWIVNAHMLLHGRTLYHDISSVSPPLIYYLYLPPVYLSERIGFISTGQMVSLAGLALTLWSASACSRLLTVHPEFTTAAMRRRHYLLLLTVFLLCSGVYYVFDRDHIFLILTFPYLMRFMPTLRAKRYPIGMRIAIGLAAGVGFCIKPHCFVMPVTVALLQIAQRQLSSMLLSVETITVAIFTALYIAITITWFPEYFHVILPMTLAAYDAASNQRSHLFYSVYSALVFLIVFGALKPRAVSPYREDIVYLAGLCGGFLVYGWLSNGWGYSYNPLGCCMLVAAGWLTWENRYFWGNQRSAESATRASVLRVSASILVVAGTALTVTLGTFFLTRGACTTHLLQCLPVGRQVSDAMKNHQSFGTISTEFDIWAFLVDDNGASWDTRFTSLWMLPKFQDAPQGFAQRYQWIPAYVANSLADDLSHRRPEVVFVDVPHPFYSMSVKTDLLPMLMRYSEFREAWKHYRFDHDICRPPSAENTGCAFSVYVLVP